MMKLVETLEKKSMLNPPITSIEGFTSKAKRQEKQQDAFVSLIRNQLTKLFGKTWGLVGMGKMNQIFFPQP